MSENTDTTNTFPKRKKAEPINYGDSADKVEQLTRENQRLRGELAELELPETYRRQAEVGRKSDLDFLSAVLDRCGLDVSAVKSLGARIVARMGQAVDRDHSLADENRRLGLLRQLEIDLRYAGRLEAADAIVMKLADALASKL